MKLFSSLAKHFAAPKDLEKLGILGMNARNHNYIMAQNPRQFYPKVDNKLLTKKLAIKAGIHVPEMIGVIQHQYEISHFESIIGNSPNFVIKPTKGSGGRGILVVVERQGDLFVKSDGEVINFNKIYQHITNILSGLYSLGGQTDFALIERCIRFSDTFKAYSYQGVPDIRIIVYRGYPVMSMMRLSTHASDGRANLHQGAIGVGIDITTGKAINAIQQGKIIHQHPDTGQDLSLLQVPNWDKVLNLATKCYEMTRLGYLGADIVLDEHQQPLLLELNARPGLAIQIANGAGLATRLQLIDQLIDEDAFPLPPEQRIQLILQHFQH